MAVGSSCSGAGRGFTGAAATAGGSTTFGADGGAGLNAALGVTSGAVGGLKAGWLAVFWPVIAVGWLGWDWAAAGAVGSWANRYELCTVVAAGFGLVNRAPTLKPSRQVKLPSTKITISTG